MKPARKFIFLFLLILSIQANAQIVNEIISYVDSTELIVNNGRKFLLNRISVQDHEKAKEIFQYLTDYTKDQKYAAFDFTEEIYFHLLMGNWQALTSQMINYTQRANRRSDPQGEEIASFLHEKVTKASDSLLRACAQSDLDRESVKVTSLLLHLVKAGNPDYYYNKQLKEFRREYKKSVYDDFIIGYLPPLKVNSALSFSVGSGIITFDNKLKESFSSNASVNFSMDINYNKLFTSLYLNTSGLKLKTPFTVFSDTDTTNFYHNDSFVYVDGGLKVGYFLIRSDRFHIAPYVTIGGISLESDIYEMNPIDKTELKILNSFTFGPAMHTEVKLFEYKNTDAMGITRSKYFSLKVEGGYNYMTKTHFSEFKGNTTYISVALAWGSGYF